MTESFALFSTAQEISLDWSVRAPEQEFEDSFWPRAVQGFISACDACQEHTTNGVDHRTTILKRKGGFLHRGFLLQWTMDGKCYTLLETANTFPFLGALGLFSRVNCSFPWFLHFYFWKPNCQRVVFEHIFFGLPHESLDHQLPTSEKTLAQIPPTHKTKSLPRTSSVHDLSRSTRPLLTSRSFWKTIAPRDFDRSMEIQKWINWSKRCYYTTWLSRFPGRGNG